VPSSTALRVLVVRKTSATFRSMYISIHTTHSYVYMLTCIHTYVRIYGDLLFCLSVYTYIVYIMPLQILQFSSVFVSLKRSHKHTGTRTHTITNIYTNTCVRTCQTSLKILPRNPSNRQTQISRSKFKLNRNDNFNLYREILRNLDFTIPWMSGV